MTDEQYTVAYEMGTETPFKNAYWDNHEKGLYKSIASGAPLFTSEDKYDSGTGWPSFSKPVADSCIKEWIDTSLFMSRTEVFCSTDAVHLGHVFNDGPSSTGKRYCMDSTSMKFVPFKDLSKEERNKYFKQ